MNANLGSIAADPNKSLVILDNNCRGSDGKLVPANQNWTLANYLLIKGDHTYLTNEDDTISTLSPHLFLPIGLASGTMQTTNEVYWRHFENALALVNPSATGTVTYTNPVSEILYDMNGVAVSRTVTLAPATALLLLSAKMQPDGLASQASPPNDGLSEAFPYSETTVNGLHRVYFYLNGSPSVSWTATVHFQRLNGSTRDVKIQLLNSQATTNNVYAICKGDGSSANTTIAGLATSVSSKITKLADNSIVCRLSAVLNGTIAPPGTNNIRLVVSGMQGTASSYVGSPTALIISEIHLEQIPMPNTTPITK
jgi:hypothetical protein